MMSARHSSDAGGDATAQIEGMYFLSAAVNDRLINAWSVPPFYYFITFYFFIIIVYYILILMF